MLDVELPHAVSVDLDDTIVDGSAVVDCWEVACECCSSAIPVADGAGRDSSAAGLVLVGP